MVLEFVCLTVTVMVNGSLFVAAGARKAAW